MTTDLFIVTYARDFRYLKYCLRSVQKFATGFRQLKLLVPDQDFDGAVACVRENAPTFPVAVSHGTEWKDKGMLWHMAQVMRAPEHCPGADFICHIDSDCVFTEPVKAEDYFVDGKPVLMYASFEWLIKQQSNIRNWQVACENAIGGIAENEFMRQHGATHPVKTYLKAKECIECRQQKPMDDYIRSGRNEFPQLFCEFTTLGEVGWRCFRDDYRFWNQETEGMFPRKIHQGWSHREPDERDMEEFKKAGLV